MSPMKRILVKIPFAAVCAVMMLCTGSVSATTSVPAQFEKSEGRDSETTMRLNPPKKENPRKAGDDTTPPPMFVMGSSNNDLKQMVYWAEREEPKADEDNAEYFDEIHQQWAIQDLFRRNADQYTKLIVDGVKTVDVKYVDELWLNPDGEPMYLGELHGRPEIPSPGARFALADASSLPEESVGIVVVTDSYLASHRPLEIRHATEADEAVPLPPSVIKQMEEKYGMRVHSSVMSYIIGDRYTYGVLQFEGAYPHPKKIIDPEYSAALALEIITDGDIIYSYPVEGYYFPDEGPIWHADDGGEYFPGHIAAAFDGPQGPEFYFVHWAPESATIGNFLIRDGQLDCQEYTVYHSLIDEESPVWKKDIEEMKRLYVAEDPHENENVKLTKWAHVYLDYEGDQIWISDEAEENGAFFTLLNGELKLIGTTRYNLSPSFPQSKNGNNYLMLSGPAGGPAYYYEIYTLRNGQVVEKFNALTVYDEIDGCSLNGEEISADKAKAYLDAIPEATEHYVGWHEIDPKE